MKHYYILFIFLTVSVESLGQDGPQIKKDWNTYGHSNVTASRLEGVWIPDTALTKRLRPDRRFKSDTLEWVVDSTVKHLIPPAQLTMLNVSTEDLWGFCIRGTMKVPFVLVTLNGNPCVVWFRDQGTERYTDMESMYLYVAPAKDRQNDILLTGGDFNNQPFRAWMRLEQK